MAYINNEYCRRLLEFGTELGVPAGAQNPIGKSENYTDDNVQQPAAQYAELVRKIEEAIDSELVSFQLGLKLDTSCHGFLGYAARSAVDNRESLLMIQELLGTRMSTFSIHLDESDQSLGKINIKPLEAEEKVLRETFELFCGTYTRMSKDFFGIDESIAQVWCSYSAPVDISAYNKLSNLKWHFNMPSNAIIFPKPLLDLQLPTRDIRLKELAKIRCTEEMEKLPLFNRYTASVRKMLVETISDGSSVQEISDRLYMSPSTLKRRLREEGTSFTDILKQIRKEAACASLISSSQTVEQIALNLGFSTASNFVTTFKKWTGMSPISYRKSKQNRSS